MGDLRQKVETELLSGILPFWLRYTVDNEYGSFRGQIANDLTVDPRVDRGLILNARILWTFSKALPRATARRWAKQTSQKPSG